MIDKKTIIGLVLIFAVFGVWMYVSQPSEEERAKIKQKQDSAMAASMRAEQEAEKAERLSEDAEKKEQARQDVFFPINSVRFLRLH